MQTPLSFPIRAAPVPNDTADARRVIQRKLWQQVGGRLELGRERSKQLPVWALTFH